jgi:hypothetical protein
VLQLKQAMILKEMGKKAELWEITQSRITEVLENLYYKERLVELMIKKIEYGDQGN